MADRTIAPTKEQRLEIYKHALQCFKNNDKTNYGMCPFLFQKASLLLNLKENNVLPTLAINSPYVALYECNGMYPELEKQKPKIKKGASYWFDLDDTKSRIKVLEKAIKEIEDTIQ